MIATTTGLSAEVLRWVTVMRAERKAPRTITERRFTMARFERDLGCAAIDATADQIAEWLGRDPDGHSAASVGNYLYVLRAFYRWAGLAGIRADDPVAQLKPPRRARRTPRPITDTQYWRLIDATANDRVLRAIVLLAGRAGLRGHEIAKFHAHDVDAESRLLTVVGKGGHHCVLPAHSEILEHAKLMPAHGYWFPSQRGKYVGRQWVTEKISLLMIRNRVPGTLHCLRHYFGTELVIRGTDLRVVQELMRHASLSTTALYIGVSDQRKRAAIDKLGAIELGSNSPAESGPT